MVSLRDAVSPRAGWGIEAEGVGIRLKGTWVLTNFTWSHEPGTIAWLIGENGAGKSSLLQVLAGRAAPSTGAVRRTGPRGERPGALYYHPAMRPPGHATVGDWLRLTRKLARETEMTPVDPAFLPTRANAAKRLDRLSTGEAKRLMLTALLKRRKPFIFLDEPYEHLSGDAKEILTGMLIERAMESVVVVATNQEVPNRAGGVILNLDSDQATAITPVEEVV